MTFAAQVGSMDWLEFIAAMTAALAWPVMALIAVIVLKAPLTKVIEGRVKRLRAGGFELEMFDQGLENAAVVLDSDLGPETPTPDPATQPHKPLFSDTVRDSVAKLAAIDPSAAVMASFVQLERMLRERVDLLDPSVSREARVTLRGLGEEAVRQGIWTRAELAAFLDLIPLRNLVAHGEVGNLDESRALGFLELAAQLMDRLEQSTPSEE